ncbi:hypothetical protein [Streptomyces sp. 3213.3]|uniref:hypothetical protein n=1 Tax=Streptomyces sp. 3213.3 TaxID=1855348 RepID=UPI0010423991|nr:hypothetical protein [Streptomyces sp. 3213.3]
MPPGDARASAAVPKLEARPGGDLCALRPAAGKPDSIAGRPGREGLLAVGQPIREGSPITG